MKRRSLWLAAIAVAILFGYAVFNVLYAKQSKHTSKSNRPGLFGRAKLRREHDSSRYVCLRPSRRHHHGHRIDKNHGTVLYDLDSIDLSQLTTGPVDVAVLEEAVFGDVDGNGKTAFEDFIDGLVAEQSDEQEPGNGHRPNDRREQIEVSRFKNLLIEKLLDVNAEKQLVPMDKLFELLEKYEVASHPTLKYWEKRYLDHDCRGSNRRWK